MEVKNCKGDAQCFVVMSVGDQHEATWGDCAILKEQFRNFSFENRIILKGGRMIRLLYRQLGLFDVFNIFFILCLVIKGK